MNQTWSVSIGSRGFSCCRFRYRGHW